MTPPRRRAVWIFATSAALGAACWVASTTSLAGPASSATPSAPPSSSVTTPPVEVVPFASVSIPSERSAVPKPAEWEQAKEVRLDRRTVATTKCRAFVLREYMKVKCAVPMVGVRQFAGSIEDVQVAVVPKDEPPKVFLAPLGGHVVFPLRRGQGLLFQFFEAATGGYGEGFFPANGAIVDAYWPAGDAAPTVTVR